MNKKLLATVLSATLLMNTFSIQTFAEESLGTSNAADDSPLQTN